MKQLFCIFCILSTAFAECPRILCHENPLLDTEIEIEIVDLKPGQVVLVESTWIDGDQIEWFSEGVFQANQEGIIEVAKQAPITGNYEGIDPMGLFWSMQMRNVIPFSEEDDDPCGRYCLPYQLSVFDGKKLIARQTICRCFQDEDVEYVVVRENGLYGNLFLPPIDDPMPVVLVLTGSNGGIQSATAAMIASHGIPAFALAYSGFEDLPSTVDQIPLEYFEKAFEWIQQYPRLNGEIFLHGTSRGAELALILGSYFPEKIAKIVAVAPSSVVLSSDSWVYEDEPILPAAPFFIDFNNDPNSFDSTRENPRSIRIHRERGLTLERERFNQAAIPVERIQCPILLVSGGDDQLGPCSTYAKLILERLDEYDSSIFREHLDFPNAGHLISEPYIPRCNVYCCGGIWMNYGGTPKEDEWASRKYWKRTLDFLKEDCTIFQNKH